jgi:hypothetical protein
MVFAKEAEGQQMNLDFATEAAKRGCPYVDKCFDEIDFIFSTLERELISESMSSSSRFVCGATLAMWWEDYGVRVKFSDFLNAIEAWDEAQLSKRLAFHARNFARGKK